MIRTSAIHPHHLTRPRTHPLSNPPHALSRPPAMYKAIQHLIIRLRLSYCCTHDTRISNQVRRMVRGGTSGQNKIGSGTGTPSYPHQPTHNVPKHPPKLLPIQQRTSHQRTHPPTRHVRQYSASVRRVRNIRRSVLLHGTVHTNRPQNVANTVIPIHAVSHTDTHP